MNSHFGQQSKTKDAPCLQIGQGWLRVQIGLRIFMEKRQAIQRQRLPGRGKHHCFQKPRGPRLRVQRIVIRRLRVCCQPENLLH